MTVKKNAVQSRSRLRVTVKKNAVQSSSRFRVTVKKNAVQSSSRLRVTVILPSLCPHLSFSNGHAPPAVILRRARITGNLRYSLCKQCFCLPCAKEGGSARSRKDWHSIYNNNPSVAFATAPFTQGRLIFVNIALNKTNNPSVAFATAPFTQGSQCLLTVTTPFAPRNDSKIKLVYCARQSIANNIVKKIKILKAFRLNAFICCY